MIESDSENVSKFFGGTRVMDGVTLDIKKILNLTPQLLDISFKRIWYSYDEEADVLYLNFKKPSRADDSVLTDDDVIIRYENGEITGITVLHASERKDD